MSDISQISEKDHHQFLNTIYFQKTAFKIVNKCVEEIKGIEKPPISFFDSMS